MLSNVAIGWAHHLQVAALRAEQWLARQPLGQLLLALYLISLFLTITIGITYSFRSSMRMLDYDEWEYWQLSGSLLEGAFADPGRRTLGYPLLLAALRLVRDDFHFVQATLALLSATAVPMLAWTMLRAGATRLAAMLAGVVLACWPPHLFLATSLYSEALTLPLLLLFLGLLPRPGRSGADRALMWLFCGLLLGFVAHVRTMYQLFVPVVLLILLVEGWPWRAALARWSLILAGFLVMVLPWSVYVSGKIGSPVLLTANGGETLAGGFNPKLYEIEGQMMHLEKRSAWVGPGKWLPATETGYLTKPELELPYGEQDRLLRKRTMEWLLSNPGDAAYLTWRKLAYQWGFYPLARNGTAQLLLGNIPSIALFMLFLGSLIWQSSARQLGARLWLMPVFVAGIAVISWGSWRFRHPADAAMIAVVAAALAAWLASRGASLRQPVATKNIAANA